MMGCEYDTNTTSFPFMAGTSMGIKAMMNFQFVSPTATPRDPINFYPMHSLGMKLQQFYAGCKFNPIFPLRHQDAYYARHLAVTVLPEERKRKKKREKKGKENRESKNPPAQEI